MTGLHPLICAECNCQRSASCKDRDCQCGHGLRSSDKSSENRVLYEVKAGETVESVASDYRIDKEQIYEWNTQLDTDSVLAEGEMITLSVPETLLSVVMTKRETYDEAYRATPQYIQDEEAQKGKNTIEEEGSTGTRKVTAEVSYINGRRTDTKIIDEKSRQNRSHR